MAQVVGVPGSDFAASLYGALVVGLTDEVEGEGAHDRHIVSAMPKPEAREVLLDGDVEDPRNAILNAPMAPRRLGESLGG